MTLPRSRLFMVRGSISGADAPSVTVVCQRPPGLSMLLACFMLMKCLTECSPFVLALNAASRLPASSCGWVIDESSDPKLAVMAKLPLSVRLFPDAAGTPDEASSASSTKTLAAPPGPQPVTPGAEKVVSTALTSLSVRTMSSGWTVGTGSFAKVIVVPGVPCNCGCSTTGNASVPMEQLLPSSGLISWNFTACVQVKRSKSLIGPTCWARANTWLSAGLAAACWQMFSTVATLLGQPSAVVRLSGIRSGLVDKIADGPASGGTAGAGKKLASSGGI